MKTIKIAGLTSTGKLTLGNYLGALKNVIELQNDSSSEMFLFVADSHALTSNIPANELVDNVFENLKIYLSCGLDIKKAKLFVQSHIAENTELFYYLSTFVYKGELERMTQYKDKKVKLKNGTEMIPTGLFIYPVLMAADIMLFNSSEVIVGDDQTQHIELTRLLIERVNKALKLNFNIPVKVAPKIGARIMGLKNPENKMSKSDLDKTNTIFLLDSPEDVKKKIKAAITDSENKIYFDAKNKPGVTNLLNIYCAIKNISQEEALKFFEDKNYGFLKDEVINVVNSLLAPIQKRFNSLTANDVKKALKYNYKFIKKIAEENISLVKKGLGLI